MDIFLKEKGMHSVHGAVDHTGVASPRIHRGLHSGWRPRLTGAQPSGHSRARWLAVVRAKWRGECAGVEGTLTRARTAMRTWHDGGKASAPNRDGAGAIPCAS
jgi:hypothetical protein